RLVHPATSFLRRGLIRYDSEPGKSLRHPGCNRAGTRKFPINHGPPQGIDAVEFAEHIEVSAGAIEPVPEVLGPPFGQSPLRLPQSQRCSFRVGFPQRPLRLIEQSRARLPVPLLAHHSCLLLPRSLTPPPCSLGVHPLLFRPPLCLLLV